MSLKCSVFGHRFGETDVDREREEDGSEVVITIREVETCQRCGTDRVVSENKEVTTLETPMPDEGGAEETATDEATDEGAVAGSARADDTDHADDAEFVDDAEADKSTIPDAEGGPAADVAGPGESVPEADATDPATDDGVILDDEAEDESTADREPGEWPDESESSPAEDETPEPTADPAAAAESVEEYPEDADEDASVEAGETDDSTSTASSGGHGQGEWPEETMPDERHSSDWAPETSVVDEPDVEPAGEAVTVPEGNFRCPECGFTTAVEASSLRAGDFCPECHRGSLEHLPDEE